MEEDKKYKFTLELTEEEIVNGKHPHVLPINPRQLKSIFYSLAKDALMKAWSEQAGLVVASVNHVLRKGEVQKSDIKSCQ